MATGIEPWLLGECHAVVGDGAETAALILDQLPAMPAEPLPLAEWMERRILPLRGLSPDVQRSQVLGWVRSLPRWERFTLLKLLTGELRVGVSQTLVVRALAAHAGVPVTTIAWRLTGTWTPTTDWYHALVSPEATADDHTRPYPFALATPLEPASTTPEALQAALGEPAAWQFEWKWDGIRAQIVRRGARVVVWSRGDELLTDRFPEIRDAARHLPDGTVLDGEILAWRDDRPLPFSALQQRIGRERRIARTARDVPVAFVAYDVLEHGGRDIRTETLAVRWTMLEGLVAGVEAATTDAPAPVSAGLPFDDEPAARPRVLRLSERVAANATAWDTVAAEQRRARQHGVEGLMLKRLAAPYTGGRKRGDWWKWKVEPYTIDAVLIYAQPGSGKRASLLTDYTFGLWDGDTLVPVAKAYSGLSNEEIANMDRWIRRHTVARFGPVRHVEPVHVIELGFEAIARSTRHRSGVAVRFPRMLRLRPDKQARDADTLATLLAMLPEPV
jgi:DNA ligase-1